MGSGLLKGLGAGLISAGETVGDYNTAKAKREDALEQAKALRLRHIESLELQKDKMAQDSSQHEDQMDFKKAEAERTSEYQTLQEQNLADYRSKMLDKDKKLLFYDKEGDYLGQFLPGEEPEGAIPESGLKILKTGKKDKPDTRYFLTTGGTVKAFTGKIPREYDGLLKEEITKDVYDAKAKKDMGLDDSTDKKNKDDYKNYQDAYKWYIKTYGKEHRPPSPELEKKAEAYARKQSGYGDEAESQFKRLKAKMETDVPEIPDGLFTQESSVGQGTGSAASTPSPGASPAMNPKEGRIIYIGPHPRVQLPDGTQRELTEEELQKYKIASGQRR